MDPPGRPERRASTRFAIGLGAIALVALVARLGFGWWVAPDLPAASDVGYYREVASHVAAGEGYVEPVGPHLAPEPPLVATATHPPGHPVVLAVGDRLGLRSAEAQRALLSVVSTGGIVLVGLLGRRVGGELVGLVAAGIGALHPLWVQHAGMLVSEATYLPLVAGVLLVADVARQRRTWPWWVALGVLVGLAALTRVEALLLVGTLGLPMALLGPGWRRRVRDLALVAGAALLVVGPWVVRNDVRVGVATISTNGAPTLAGSYCDQTFEGPRQGGFSLPCSLGVIGALAEGEQPGPDGRVPPGPIDAGARSYARTYASAHRGRLPAVLVSRLARLAGVGHLGDALELDVREGRHRPTQRVGFVVGWTVLLAAVGGVVRLVRRRDLAHLLLLGSTVATAVLTGALLYGSTRLRVVAEPSLVVLAAVGLDPLLRRVRSG